jgi:hypothetical protein
MYVKIGKYRSWIGPYQIADLGKKIGISDDTCYKFGTWLADTWVNAACNWIHSKKKRQIKVRIDKYDTWGMYDTLAIIILPMLKQLNEEKHGAPNVDDEDVPEHLRSTSAPPKDQEWDIDSNHFLRWEWVMAEMIWGFEQLLLDDDTDQFWSVRPELDLENRPEDEGKAAVEVRWITEGVCDWEGMRAHENRKRNAFRLFGKYFQSLWD